MAATVVVTLGVFCFAGTTHTQGATVVVTERSEPPGITNRSTIVVTPVEHLTLTAPIESAGYRFTHWTINGTRRDDFTGRAMNPVRFMVYEAIDAVAHYLPAGQDTVGDCIPDWWRILHFGHLGHPATEDLDGDGLTLAEEYRYDTHPALSNAFIRGGVSMRNGEMVTVQIDPNFFVYSERSDPVGLVDRSLVVSNGTVVTSQNLGEPNQGYAFACWEVGGERQADALGMSLTRFSMPITNHTAAVAHYVPLEQDTVGDGLPNWWRLRHYGHLNTAAEADTDGDGMTLAEEFRYDMNPLVSNSLVTGGISMRNGELTLVNLAGFYRWSIVSEPAGLIQAQSGVAETGTVIVTMSLGNPISGYGFGYWSLNGERQADGSGVALSRLVFALETNMNAVACFFPVDNDTDGNSLPDWWEQRHFGALGQDPGADIPGGGMTIGEAYRHDYNPTIAHAFLSGGVSMRDSEAVTVNLQPFERVSHILVEGVLTKWFAIWPTGTLGTASFGPATAPALGDWDGDKVADLFVTTSNGSLHVFENTGSRYTPDLTERPAAAAALETLLDGIAEPHLALGDWSGDGRADLVVGGRGGAIRLVSSSGHFDAAQTPATVYDIALGNEAGRVLPALMDVTGDGLPDLLVLTEDGRVGVFAHSGNQGRPYDLPLLTNDLLGVQVPAATGISAADINRNGMDDLLVSDVMGRIWEFHRQPDASFVLISRVWAGSAPGFAERMAVSAADLDGDGDADAFVGFEQGGLMFLRDPRLGPPSNLRAVGGADSVALNWEPDRQTRVHGYVVYRASTVEGPFAKLHEALLTQPSYVDQAVVAGTTYWYYVTAVTLAYFPGSTVGALRESPPSEVVEAEVGGVRLWMPDYAGGRGQTAVLKINVDRAEGIAGQALSIGVLYDPAILTPISQIDEHVQTVRRTALTEDLVFSDNALTANGELMISGHSGGALGAGCLFDVVFQVAADAPPEAQSTNAFSTAAMFGLGGQPLTVDATDIAVFTVTSTYRLGDVNGDGVLDMNDHQHLLWLLRRSTRDPTTLEIQAGDMDGDGRLTQRDIPLLLRLIHGKSVNP